MDAKGLGTPGLYQNIECSDLDAYALVFGDYCSYWYNMFSRCVLHCEFTQSSQALHIANVITIFRACHDVETAVIRLVRSAVWANLDELHSLQFPLGVGMI